MESQLFGAAHRIMNAPASRVTLSLISLMSPDPPDTGLSPSSKAEGKVRWELQCVERKPLHTQHEFDDSYAALPLSETS
jgi:hypothetical protein